MNISKKIERKAINLLVINFINFKSLDAYTLVEKKGNPDFGQKVRFGVPAKGLECETRGECSPIKTGKQFLSFLVLV